MFDLTITRLVEDWAQSRRRQRVLNEAAGAAAVGLWILALAVTIIAWVPDWVILIVPATLAVLALAGVVLFRLHRTPRAEDVAAEVDGKAGTKGLLRTALSVEKGLADCGRDLGVLVQDQAVERAATLGDLGAPQLAVPVPLLVAAGVAVLFGIVGPTAAQFAAPDDRPVIQDPDQARSAFARADVRRLSRSVRELDALADQPGVTPLARRDLERARDLLRKALSAHDDPRAAARELDRAQSLVQALGGQDLVSAEVLKQTHAEKLADGLDRALTQGDAGLARRVGEELLRRVDGGVNDNELRRLGKALAERVDGTSKGGAAAQKAGQSLQAGDRQGAMSALADLMAELGEAARYEQRPAALADAEEAIRDARLRALSSLGEDQAPDGVRSPSQGGADAPPTNPGEGRSPSPIDLPPSGNPADGGDGTSDGGSEDLRPSGTPGPGGEPEVRVDSRPPPGGTEGPLAEGGALTAGEGPAQEGDVPQDAPAGAGEGPVQNPGGMPQAEGPGQGATATAGVSPGAGGGVRPGQGPVPDVATPFVEVELGAVPEEWVKAQWDGAGESMGETLREAAAGGRSGLAWTQVHNRYSALAEAATRQDRLPLTRRSFVRQYFEAIRPHAESTSSKENP